MKFCDVIYIVVVVVAISVPSACTHETILGDSPQIDTMMTDTTPVDTTMHDTTMVVCDTSIIYFAQNVLPILKRSCAISGCHDAQSARDGVVLDNYDDAIRTTGTVPFDLSESDLYEVITESDLDDRMPPAPRQALPQEEIAMIAQWILQGATNDSCQVITTCDIEQVSYMEDIEPVLITECRGCHSGSSPSAGIVLENYDDARAMAESGALFAVVSWQSGVTPMPFNRDQLEQCFIDKLQVWIDEGAQNN